MFVGLRFYEDLVSAIRGILALTKLFLLHNRNGGHELRNLWLERQSLESSVMQVAVENGLPLDYKDWLQRKAGQGRLSLRRQISRTMLKRTHTDWNDSLRLWEQLDQDEDEVI